MRWWSRGPLSPGCGFPTRLPLSAPAGVEAAGKSCTSATSPCFLGEVAHAELRLPLPPLLAPFLPFLPFLPLDSGARASPHAAVLNDSQEALCGQGDVSPPLPLTRPEATAPMWTWFSALATSSNDLWAFKAPDAQAAQTIRTSALGPLPPYLLEFPRRFYCEIRAEYHRFRSRNTPGRGKTCLSTTTNA